MQKYHIIPKPFELHSKEGFFNLQPGTIIIADSQNERNGAYLRDLLEPSTGYSLSFQSDFGPRENSITLKIDPALTDLGEEGYALNIEEERVIIRASTAKGVFYGIQTLRQLLPVEIESRKTPTGIIWQIPCCQIRDYPRFSWRGYMLDEGRHFHGKEIVLQVLDLMALHKLNVFHWHLTEDQGWRIEIKRYPKLTEIASQRAGTARSWKEMRKKEHDGVPHGGYYTQDEIREIVVYASERNITIVPEIETPGHSKAVLSAYPELTCTGRKFDVPTRFGIFKDIYCAGKESTFEFLQNVLDEVMDLFPSKIIHIGGDEAPKTRWKKCPDCQRRIQSKGLKNEHELQTYFTNRIGEYLKSHGRQMMGWNEILGDSLSEDAIVHYWVRNKKELLAALKNGQKVVNSAYLDTYLDHSYSLTPLRRAYHFNPIIKGVDAEAAKNILGLEPPMWTEWVPNRARLDYQTYPRLTAFAEVGWTPESHREYDDFRERLATFNRRLDIHGVLYAPADDWEPPWYKRLFGTLTIVQPQTRTRELSR